ncbi:MAG TPA: G5 domain-containing protein, partial [Oscillospiraceae bacterium]|nr:G5 domain-containing protein [Oscillospiraceae bacterium]
FVRGGELHVRIYSKKTDSIYIDLESEILEVIEPKMQIKKDENMYLSERKVGKNGKKGYRVATYKVYLQGGREIKKELISKDYYPSGDGLIIEGTKQEY